MNDFISAPAGTPDVDNEIQFLKGKEEFFKALIKDYQTLVDTSTFFEAHPIYFGQDHADSYSVFSSKNGVVKLIGNSEQRMGPLFFNQLKVSNCKIVAIGRLGFNENEIV